MKKKKPSVRVLFVCMGNICRSPTGEGVFRRFVAEQDCEVAIEIDSAGTIAYHAGEPADERMRVAAAKRGYELESIARAVTRADITNFDLIVAMDGDNYDSLQSLAEDGNGKIVMLGRYVPGVAGDHDVPSVPDPYYGGPQGFETVIDMIESACPALFEHCLSIIESHRR